MSDLTICNFCRLQGYRRQAKENNKKVSVRTGTPYKNLPAGIAIYIHPKELKNEDRFQKQFHVAWFMELTDRCVC